MSRRTPIAVTAKIEPDGSFVTVIGRDAWALLQLVAAGNRGCTPLHNPAPRWSHYVYKLRQAGFVIETVQEAHGGAFAGNHGRYVLRSKVSILDGALKDAA